MSRAPSMADVAVAAGVSHQTVSRVLNGSLQVRDETRTKVFEAIDTLGYRRNRAARTLATNRSGRIGMISAHQSLHGPSMIASAVQEAGHAQGYDVSFVGLADFSVESLNRAVERLLDEAVEALVIAVAHRTAAERVDALELTIPVVRVQGVDPGQLLAAGVDQVAGAVAATNHLLELGHRDVAHVTGPLVWSEARQRRAGWIEAHAIRGIARGVEIPGDWSAASGHAAGRRLAADVTAVFVGNDTMALGLLSALHEGGRRVPDDVSVVGFDDAPDAAFLWPALTTVAQPFAELGREVVALTVRAIHGETAPAENLIRPKLVVRASTSARRRN